ncbi:MAG: hypothetical protein ACE5KS_04200 [Woeseiaceae bacterium]
MRKLATHSASISLPGLIAVTVAVTLIRGAYDSQTLRWPHVYEISSPYHKEALWAAAKRASTTNA